MREIDIVYADEWFELRDLRNEIAHDYENNDYLAIDILKNIFELKHELKNSNMFRYISSVCYIIH